MKTFKHNYGKLLFPSLLLFTSISLVFVIASDFWDRIGINHHVVLGSNLLLYCVSTLTLWMHVKAIKNPNPNVFSNSVMGGTLIKLMVLGISTVVYLLVSGIHKSVFAIFIGMFLYILYTILDVKTALILNKKG